MDLSVEWSIYGLCGLTGVKETTGEN